MSELSGSTSYCNLIKPSLTLPTQPYLTKVNIPCIIRAGGSLDPVAPSPDTCCQITIFKSYQKLANYILGPLKLIDLCRLSYEKCK